MIIVLEYSLFREFLEPVYCIEISRYIFGNFSQELVRPISLSSLIFRVQSLASILVLGINLVNVPILVVIGLVDCL